jgi:chaperonin GroEL (HSP60 family)
MNCFIMGLNSIALLFWQELEDPLILIHEKKISNLNAIVKVLELALKVSD